MEMVEEIQNQNQPKIPPKQTTLHEIVEEDRISRLPDSLLLEILSRLPYTQDAIRTGTLSKRWKRVWTWVSSLYFYNYDRFTSDFFSNVDETLTQCRQLKLKKFNVYTTYHTRNESQLNNWIRYAISCNVEQLSLVFCSGQSEFVLDHYFFINSCFTHLKLGTCIFNLTGEISWKNLRRLSIAFGKLDEALIENILSGSPVLESLVLFNCSGFKRLDITSKSVKKLEFSGYEDLDESDFSVTIEINAPDILFLEIKGALFLGSLLLNVPSSVEANLNCNRPVWEGAEEEEEMLKGLMLNLRHVKEVKIGLTSSKILSRLEAKGINIPSNVKLPKVSPPSNFDDDDDDDDWLEVCNYD